jgi:phenylpropionate dioxygenase-like ring-hydroxylating dioxygenase large terminal subunit
MSADLTKKHSGQDWLGQSVPAQAALTLPSRYFLDEAVFARERSSIFMSAWHAVGHKSELTTPGQFVMRDIFDQSVVVSCDSAGSVHAFHNVCQHRGNRLIEQPRGLQKGGFRCAYHSWCYNLDGSLMSAPRTEHLPDFDVRATRIPRVRVEELGGFYYLNFDSNAPALQALFPGADAAMREAFPQLESYRLVEEVDVEVHANWKVIMDNAIEGYHFPRSGPAHIALADLIDFDQYRLSAHDQWWTYIAPATRTASSAYGVPLTGVRDPKERFFNITLWPGSTFYTFPYSQLLGTFHIVPVDAEHSRLRFGYYSTTAELPPVTRACMEWMNRDLGPEDIRLNVSVQRGLHSMGYDQGRYVIDPEHSNESEHLIHHFHKLVYRAIHGAR